jgi:hypothetical protein
MNNAFAYQMASPGEIHGRYTLLHLDPSRAQYWVCKCSCGTVRSVLYKYLASGNTQSCGCFARDTLLARNTTHGMSYRGPVYRAWANMMQRCHNPQSANFERYGRRGISVCPRWHDARLFYEDMQPTYPGCGYSLDRKDNSQGYSFDNCRWATRKEQQTNTRRTRLHEYGGKTLCLKDIAKELNAPYSTFTSRVNRLGVEKAMMSYGYHG